MKLYLKKITTVNVRSQKAYDSLMNQLESKNYTWVTDRKLKSLNMYYRFNRNTVIIMYQDDKTVAYANLESEFNQESIQVFKPKDKLEFN